MKLFQNYEFEKYVFIFLILFYVLGIAIVKDYGFRGTSLRKECMDLLTVTI